MGAFHLVLRDQAVGVERSLAVFSRRGMPLARKVQIGGMDLYLFSKKWVEGEIALEISNPVWEGAASVGTMVYKSRLGRDATLSLACDVIDESVDHARLIGDFFFFMWSDRALRVLQSNNHLFHIFANREKSALGSSFLAVAAGEESSPRIDKRAALQNLLTGCQFGRSTLLQGIESVADVSSVALDFGFEVIELPGAPAPIFRNFGESVEGIEGELDRYFGELSGIGAAKRVSIGLSGGYDSRLLLGSLVKHGFEVQPHTHYRPVEDEDERIARKLAGWAGTPLLTVPVPLVGELSPARMSANLEESYWVCDGSARVNLGWLSEFRREWYRREIAGGAKLGLNGICGELFRNFGNFVLPTKSVANWVRESVLESFSWWHLRPKSRRDVLESIVCDIGSALGWDDGKRRVNRRDHREFYYRGWVSGGPSLRNNIEHPCWFFLSPFCEHRVVDAALAATDFLGPDAQLEEALIMRCNAALARVESNYGRSFTQARSQNLARAWLRGLLPPSVKRLRRKSLLSRRRGRPSNGGERVARVCHRELSAVAALDLPLVWDAIEKDDWALNRSVALGYFILKQGG